MLEALHRHLSVMLRRHHLGRQVAAVAAPVEWVLLVVEVLALALFRLVDLDLLEPQAHCSVAVMLVVVVLESVSVLLQNPPRRLSIYPDLSKAQDLQDHRSSMELLLERS